MRRSINLGTNFNDSFPTTEERAACYPGCRFGCSFGCENSDTVG